LLFEQPIPSLLLRVLTQGNKKDDKETKEHAIFCHELTIKIGWIVWFREDEQYQA